MTYVAFDPGNVDLLRSAMSAALDDLYGIGCADVMAESAMRAVRSAIVNISQVWTPVVAGVAACDALTRFDSVSLSGAAVGGEVSGEVAGDVAGEVHGGRLAPGDTAGGHHWMLAELTGTRWASILGATCPVAEVGPADQAGVADAEIEHIGARNLDLPEGASVVEFPIPRWRGSGVTRIQYFIDDDDVCLSGVGPDIVCGHGDDRGFATGEQARDYNLPARVRIVLDHERGSALVIASPTHGSDGEIDALPIRLHTDGPTGVFPDSDTSEVRVWTRGDGIDGNIVFSYHFLNSETPSWAGGVAPAITGAIRVRRGPDGSVTFDGKLAHYPSVEIIRDVQLPFGYASTLIFTKAQDPGGPMNLYKPVDSFDAHG